MTERYHLHLAEYHDRAHAVAAWHRLLERHHAGALDLKDGAVLDRDAAGKVTIDERLHHPVAKGTLIGLALGALTPVTLVLGAATGALAGKIHADSKRSITEADARNLAELVERGHALVVAIVEERDGPVVDEVFADAAARVGQDVTTTHAQYNQLLRDYEGGTESLIPDA